MNQGLSGLSRRDAVRAAALAFAAGMIAPRLAFADEKAVAAEIKKLFGDKKMAQGKIKLDVPEIAENGNTVPMTVSVDSPMTEQSYVTDLMVVADANPRGGVVTFRFSPASGVAEANTRIRLAETQNVVAVAKMSDGSVFMDTKLVKVTIGGCGG